MNICFPLTVLMLLVSLTFYFRGVTSQSLDNFNYYNKTIVKEENSSLKKDTTGSLIKYTKGDIHVV